MASNADALAEAWRDFRAGDRQRAGAIALRILQADPEQVPALALLGTIALAQSQLVEAAQYFREVLARQPDDADSHNSLGVAMARQGKLAEAIPHFRNVLSLTPDSAQAHNNLGLILKDQGQPVEAERLFRQALHLNPGFSAAYNNLGLALKEQGKLDEALASLRQAIALDASTPEAHQNLGLVLRMQGRLIEAEASLRQTIQLRANYAEAHSTLGNVLREQGRLDEAEASCRQALRLSPNSGEAHNNLALVLQEQNKLDEALAHLQQALRCKPNSTEIYNNLGLLLQMQGKHDESRACYQRATQLTSDQAEEFLRSGRLLQEMRRFSEAEASLRQAIRLQPESAAAYTALGGLLQEAGNPDEAELQFRQALRLNPDHFAYDNLGTALARQGKNPEARASFQQALTLRPDFIGSIINAGNTYACEGALAEAEQQLRRALQLDPKSAEAHYSLAMVLLLQGDFERGWPEYEWRWLARGVRRVRPNFHQPLWDGSELAGRTILLHAEGGLGDSVQFIRYAALMKQRGGTVVFDSHPALVDLLRGCSGIDRIIPRGDALPDFDVHAPLMSLPFIFGTRLATIPATVPYLSVDPELAERWRREVAGLPGLKIGIGWQGSPQHYHDRVRSFPLACFEPLARLAGVHLIILQKHAGREQLPEFAARFPITDLGARLDETSGAYLDTPAVMQSLDLVITPDSSLAHIAGALGVPVWLALPHVPEWRWLLDRNDSPWYPTMRLFRQSQPGDWQGVFQRMAAEVADQLARGS
jgi:tetratricopeptide (TPR) repeat protein